MKPSTEFYCTSDAGGVLIGNSVWTFLVPNFSGDGFTEVRVYESDYEAFEDDPWSCGVEFLTFVQGAFGIYGHDCCHRDLLSGTMTEDDTVYTLDGRYAVYSGNYKVAFVKACCQ